MKEIILQIAWIERLKYYTDAVKDSVTNDVKHKMAILSLLGYLESLEYLLK